MNSTMIMGKNDYVKIKQEAYQQGRADKYQEIISKYMLLTEKQVEDIRNDAIDECKYNAELFREIFLGELINQSVDREEAIMYRNICEMSWSKYLEQLKENQNDKP